MSIQTAIAEASNAAAAAQAAARHALNADHEAAEAAISTAVDAAAEADNYSRALVHLYPSAYAMPYDAAKAAADGFWAAKAARQCANVCASRVNGTSTIVVSGGRFDHI